MRAFLLAVAVAAAVAAIAPPDEPDNPSSTDYIYMGARPTYDESQFAGKKILVTGGSSGMGFATAMSLARFGADVVICSRDSHPSWYNGSDAERRIKEDPIVKEKGGKIRWIKADVANKESIAALFAQLKKENFILDFAVNNAGIIGACGLLYDTLEYIGTEHDAVLNNLGGTLNCLEQEIALFKEQNKDAAIVNLGSVNGFRGSDGCAMYATSKFGIHGITKSLGNQYMRGKPIIRINAIAPGYTNTSLVWQQIKLGINSSAQEWEGEYINPQHPLWKQHYKEWLEDIPNHRMSDPMEQANMIIYLLAKESAMNTGGIYVVDALDGEV